MVILPEQGPQRYPNSPNGFPQGRHHDHMADQVTEYGLNRCPGTLYGPNSIRVEKLQAQDDSLTV